MKATLTCTEVFLPEEQLFEAATNAIGIFPANAPMGEIQPRRIAVLASKFWGARANDLTIGFLEQTSQQMRTMVLAFANMWGEFAKVKFRWTQTSPIIRISFGRGGYWSYLGTDCLSIPANKQTMNLEGFTTRSPVSEWHRVVKHECGHALGCPHEQQREQILALLDERKTIDYFGRTQGWSEQEVRQQILTPLEARSLMQGSSPNADQASIMCYQFPGSITKSGQPIPGGHDFSPTDREYFAKLYPPDTTQPPPPPVSGQIVTLVGLDATGKEIARFKA